MCPRVVYSVTDKPLGLEYTARVCRERENASKHGSADEHLPDAGIIRHSPDEPGTAWTIADGGVPGKPWVGCAVLPAFRRSRTTSGPAIWPFFLESRRTPSVVMRHPPSSCYAGAGLGRSPSISRKMSWNNSFGTATSAIWKMT